MKKLLPGLGLLVLLASCGSASQKNSPNDSLSHLLSDTVYGDSVIPPPALQLYLRETYQPEIDSIGKFSAHYLHHPLDSTWTKIIDLDGDGQKDTARAVLALIKNKPVRIYYSVRSKGQLIFSDTADYTKDFEEYYRLEVLDSILYTRYQPYAAFYYACSLLPFVEERDDIASFAENTATRELFLGQVAAKNPPAEQQKKWDSFRLFLKSYKGGVLSICDPLNCSGKIWSPADKKFVEFYQP